MKSEQKPALEEVLEYDSKGWSPGLEASALWAGQRLTNGLEVQGWDFQQPVETEHSGESSLRGPS